MNKLYPKNIFVAYLKFRFNSTSYIFPDQKPEVPSEVDSELYEERAWWERRAKCSQDTRDICGSIGSREPFPIPSRGVAAKGRLDRGQALTPEVRLSPVHHREGTKVS